VDGVSSGLNVDEDSNELAASVVVGEPPPTAFGKSWSLTCLSGVRLGDPNGAELLTGDAYEAYLEGEIPILVGVSGAAYRATPVKPENYDRVCALKTNGSCALKLSGTIWLE